MPKKYIPKPGKVRPRGAKKHYENFAGKKIGKLKVIRRIKNLKRKRGGIEVRWLCICECGRKDIRASYQLKRNGRCSQCIACYKEMHANKYKYGPIFNAYIRVTKSSAKQRNLPFKVDIKYLLMLLKRQKFKCALSGVTIAFAETSKLHQAGYSTASIDRIDSDKGYIKGNIQWLHKTVNLVKRNLSDEEFIEWCKIIVSYQRRKNKS